MSRVALLCFAVACTSSAAPPPPAADAPNADAHGDAATDAASCKTTTVWHELYACQCCSEGDHVCVHVIREGDTIVELFTADDPPRPDVLECVRSRVIGKCYAGDAIVCAWGI